MRGPDQPCIAVYREFVKNATCMRNPWKVSIWKIRCSGVGNNREVRLLGRKATMFLEDLGAIPETDTGGDGERGTRPVRQWSAPWVPSRRWGFHELLQNTRPR